MTETAVRRRKQPWQAPDWPQAMRKKTAAAYCDLSSGAFEREIVNGRLPTSFILGGREHWHKPALDAALDRITGGAEPEPEYLREWREKYGQPSSPLAKDIPAYHRANIEHANRDRGQDERPAYSVKSLAERWSCSEGLVRKLIHEGKLARVPSISLMRISAAEVEQYEAGEP